MIIMGDVCISKLCRIGGLVCEREELGFVPSTVLDSKVVETNVYLRIRIRIPLETDNSSGIGGRY